MGWFFGTPSSCARNSICAMTGSVKGYGCARQRKMWWTRPRPPHPTLPTLLLPNRPPPHHTHPQPPPTTAPTADGGPCINPHWHHLQPQRPPHAITPTVSTTTPANTVSTRGTNIRHCICIRRMGNIIGWWWNIGEVGVMWTRRGSSSGIGRIRRRGLGGWWVGWRITFRSMFGGRRGCEITYFF